MNRFAVISMLSAGLMVARPVSLLEAAPLFRVTNLGTLGGDYSGGSSVNDFGEVVGEANKVSGDAGYAFIYRGDAMQFLGSQAEALGKGTVRVNNHGDVIGTSSSGFVGAYVFSE